MIDKPPLNDDLLIHFGVKGMHWGHRKQRSDETERKETFNNASRNRKIKIGLAVVGGAAAIAFIMSKRGRTKVGEAAVNNFVLNRQRQAQASNNPFGNLAKEFRKTKASAVPSPDQMIAEARMAGVRNKFYKVGNQQLTEEAWRNQARVASLTKDMDDTTNRLLQGTQKNLGLAEIRRRLG